MARPECDVCKTVHGNEEPEHPYCQDVRRYVAAAIDAVSRRQRKVSKEDVLENAMQVQALGTVREEHLEAEWYRMLSKEAGYVILPPPPEKLDVVEMQTELPLDGE